MAKRASILTAASSDHAAGGAGRGAARFSRFAFEENAADSFELTGRSAVTMRARAQRLVAATVAPMLTESAASGERGNNPPRASAAPRSPTGRIAVRILGSSGRRRASALIAVVVRSLRLV